MQTPAFIFLGTLVLLCIDATAGCGGCNSNVDSEDACEVRTTRVASRSIRTTSGWWWSRSTSYKRGYYSVPGIAYQCCAGYNLRDRACEKTDCGISKYPNAGDGVSTMIVGGIEAKQNEFPWQVLVYSRSSAGNRACGGTIISDQYILTAAQCVYGRPTSQMTVYAGQHSLLDLNQIKPVRSVHTTNFQASSLTNNIAILKLRTRLTVDDTARAACLPTEDQQFVGRDVIISGWGTTVSDVNAYLQAKLRYTKVKVAPTSKCDAIYGTRPNEICATDGGTDNDRSSCYGDSGGPMVLKENGRFVVIGVASFVSSRGCAAGRPFGYADVGAHIPWIKSTTGL